MPPLPPPSGRSPLRASVVIRAKDKEETIGHTLESVRRQTVDTDVLVVDSGSRDGTVRVAESYGARILSIPPESFTYGRALNLGAANTEAEILFALSAHTVLEHDRWIEWSLDAYDDPTVAATVGHSERPDGSRLTGPERVTAHDLPLARVRTWGLSNHASSWRRSVWERMRFDEQLDANEDQEWMIRVLDVGYAVRVDPRLVVGMGHRWSEDARARFRRTQREWSAFFALVDAEPPTASELASRWWRDVYDGDRPRWQRRLDPRRSAELLGIHLGARDGVGRRDAGTFSRREWDRRHGRESGHPDRDSGTS